MGDGAGLVSSVGRDERLAALVAQLEAYVADPVVIGAASTSWPGESRIVWCNAAFEEMTGWRLDELIGRSPAVLRGPGTDPATVARIIARRHRNLPVREELLNYRKNGEPFWVDISIRPVIDAPCGGRLVVSVQREITALKRREEALRKALDAESLLAAVVESVCDEIQVVDAETFQFVRLNGRARRNLGWSASDLRKKSLPDVAVELTAGALRAAIAPLLDRRAARVSLRYAQRRRDGSDYPVSATFTPLIREGRTMLAVAVVDLSEAEAARARAEEAERRYALARAASLDGVWELDLATMGKTFSDQNRIMLGYTREEFPDDIESWRRNVHPDDFERVRSRLRRHIATDCGFDQTYRIRRSDGAWVWWRSRAAVWRDEDGAALRVIGTNSDVTMLVEARRAAEEAAQLKAGFLAKMSHEIRTPLNGVLGMAELMRVAEDDPLKLERLRAIASSGRSLLTIIEDVLALARIDAGGDPPRAAEFDLGVMCESAFDPIRPTALAKGLVLRSDAERGRFVSDERRIRQVLINLVGNAVKFTEAGEIGIDARWRAGMLVFEVWDSGPGVPEHLREIIFEPFRQGDDTPTRRHGGLGLGLAIARELVRAMGGDIAADAARTGGASFLFTAPARPV
jgi:PAS domain S-box-containing protein